MIDDIKQLRTQQINNFISSIDDLKDIEVTDIENGLLEILGEKPGVDFEYGVEHILNEATNKDERKVELKKINILYSYFESDGKPKIGKISYIVG